MMLTDPNRHRRLMAAAAIFIVAFMYSAVQKGWFDRNDPDGAPDLPVAERVTATVPEPPPTRSEGGEDGTGEGAGELTLASLERAHETAASFANEYLAWSSDESHADRLARISEHSTREMAAAIADAHQFGAADDADRDEEWSQTAEILGTQLHAVRPRHVELTVIAAVTTADSHGSGVTPVNFTVALREEEGAWLVDEVR